MTEITQAAPARPVTGGPVGTGAARRTARRLGEITAFWYVAAVLLVIAGWQAVIMVFKTPDYVLPTPVQVASAFGTFHQPLLDHTWVTVREILFGFGISMVLGVAIAVPVAFSRAVERLAYPLLVMSQAVPKVALGPLFIVWFGFGLQTNVLIAVSVAIFPVIVNTALGLTSIDPDLVRLGRSMGSTRWRLFRLIRLPHALPTVFAGLKLAITFAVIGAVVGEFLVGGAGLGYLTQSASGSQNLPLLFACIISLAVVGIAGYAAVELAERLVLRWHPSQSRA